MSSRLNERLDTIVRKPTADDRTYVPVGVVSKEYTLVQHDEIVDIAEEALCGANIEMSDELKMSIIEGHFEMQMNKNFLAHQWIHKTCQGTPKAQLSYKQRL